jgi:hypothetical protein
MEFTQILEEVVLNEFGDQKIITQILYGKVTPC